MLQEHTRTNALLILRILSQTCVIKNHSTATLVFLFSGTPLDLLILKENKKEN